MAKSATLTLIGDKELLAAFGTLKDTIRSSTMTVGLKRAAEPIISSARDNLRARAGYNPYRAYGRKAGNLWMSIGVRIRNYRNTDTKIAVIGPKWPQGAHGHLVEFGTLPRWTQTKGFFNQLRHGLKGAYRGIMPAKPFLRPAFDSRVGEALVILTTFVRNRIMRARLTGKK